MKKIKKLLTILCACLLMAQSYADVEYGRNYVIAALELKGWGHHQNLEVKEAENLSIGQLIDSVMMSLTSGSNKYDINFDLDGINYTCFVVIEGRFTKKVKISNCSNEDGSQTLPYVLKHISRRQMNQANESWQRRAGKDISEEQDGNSIDASSIQE